MREFVFALEFDPGTNPVADILTTYPETRLRSLSCHVNADTLWRVDHVTGSEDALNAVVDAVTTADYYADCLVRRDCEGEWETRTLDRSGDTLILYSYWNRTQACTSIPHLALEHFGDGLIFETTWRRRQYQWRLILPEDVTLSAFHEALNAEIADTAGVDIIRVRDTGTDDMEIDPESETVLSPEQESALLAAVEHGYYSAKNRSLDMDFLMSTAILSATGASLLFPVGLYFEAIVVAFFFNVAELLESYSVNQARASLKELMELSPDTAVVRRDGEKHQVEVDGIEVGEIVLVKPGEKIPMDGEVTDGESAVNQAPITGESVPVNKQPSDEVYAGTINEQGYLEIEVTSVASESTIARVIEMVENAQANKTKREQFVDRFAGYYTPVVVTFALLTAFVPPVLFGAAWDTWFVRGIALLVIACPCAFVISTPVSVVSGITSAARNGVLIKGGNHLELMGEVDAIAFDKTGTLTKGELTVTDIVPLNDNTGEDVLQRARGLEKRSEHPIGEAIIEHADERGIGELEIENFESITGKGVRATLDGVTHYAGKPGLFEELGFNLDHAHVATDGGVLMEGQSCEHGEYPDLAETIPYLQRDGKTVVLVGTEDEVKGVIAIADEVRPDAQAAIEGLYDAGVEPLIMLTGDNEGTAKAIAKQVGVDEYRTELLPEDKVTAVEELVTEYGTVAMVGDGINDAPAMATASVGIAMGAAGTDTALETADIALMADDLSKLLYLYDLSHTANGVIRQNIWGALAAEALLVLGVPLGLVSVLLAVVVGDVGMTVGVTGNAMRLSRINPDQVTSEV